MVKDGELSYLEKQLIDYFNSLPKDYQRNKQVLRMLNKIISDGKVMQGELDDFKDWDGDGLRNLIEIYKYHTDPFKLNCLFAYALKNLPEDVALKFKNVEYDNTSKAYVDMVSRIKVNLKILESIGKAVIDNKITPYEKNLFDDMYINPTKPEVKLKWKPSKVVLNKVYNIEVEIDAKDDKTPIANATLKFIPVEYNYFITKYGMKSQDYPKVFPPDKVREFILKPIDGKFDELEEKFKAYIKDIVGGREYKIVAIVKDIAGNKRTVEVKTSYIRQFENIARTDNITVVTYYYPWYSPSRHWKEGFTGAPLLGMYDSRDPIVISKHIDWATGHGIDAFIISWWGPNSWEDITIKDYILKNPLITNIKIGICYESMGRLEVTKTGNKIYIDLGSPNNKQTLLNDLNYLAKTYFDQPFYLRIKNAPVIVLYLARVFKDDASVINSLRKQAYNLGYDIYLIGDLVYWQNPNLEVERIKVYNAVTSYNMHTSVQEILGIFEKKVAEKYKEWLHETKNLGVGFIPSALPGFNDRAVREGNIPLPKSTERFKEQLEIAKSYIDKDLRIIAITTFNEWHEYTAIEPSVENGFEYLNILKEVVAKNSIRK